MLRCVSMPYRASCKNLLKAECSNFASMLLEGGLSRKFWSSFMTRKPACQRCKNADDWKKCVYFSLAFAPSFIGGSCSTSQQKIIQHPPNARPGIDLTCFSNMSAVSTIPADSIEHSSMRIVEAVLSAVSFAGKNEASSRWRRFASALAWSVEAGRCTFIPHTE